MTDILTLFNSIHFLLRKVQFWSFVSFFITLQYSRILCEWCIWLVKWCFLVKESRLTIWEKNEIKIAKCWEEENVESLSDILYMYFHCSFEKIMFVIYYCHMFCDFVNSQYLIIFYTFYLKKIHCGIKIKRFLNCYDKVSTCRCFANN